MMDISFLRQFISQAQTSNLKTKEYPKEIENLRLRVSFGMGTQSKVPWVQVVAHEMPTTNGYYPVFLYYKEQNVLILTYGIGESFDENESWNEEIRTTGTRIDEFLDNPFRYGNSFVFKSYEPLIEGDVIKFIRDGNEVTDDQIANELKQIIDAYLNCMDLDIKKDDSVISTGLFYMEQQLEDFIINNWDETEFGKKYELIYEDGDLKSQQYITPIGRIDILAKDKSTGDYVVIELKRNQTSDDTVGQVTRYMGWIVEKFGNTDVKGIIVAGKFDEKLYYAQKMLKNIEVFLYEVNFKLNEYKK